MTSVKYGCHVDLFDALHGPDGCVIDEGKHDNCIYAKLHKAKEECKYWLPITPENDRRYRTGDCE
jgi:hypothetical protein